MNRGRFHDEPKAPAVHAGAASPGSYPANGGDSVWPDRGNRIENCWSERAGSKYFRTIPDDDFAIASRF